MVACVDGDLIGIKLPAADVPAALRRDGVEKFEPYGKKMREWIARSLPLYTASKAAVTMLTSQYAKALPGIRAASSIASVWCHGSRHSLGDAGAVDPPHQQEL